MKLNKLNHSIEWTSESQNIFDLEVKFNQQYVNQAFSPKFNVQVKNELDQTIYEKNNLMLSQSYRRKPIVNFYLFRAETEINLRLTDPDSAWILPRDLRNWYAPYEFMNKFDLIFDYNYEGYSNLNNKLGFFNKIKVNITDLNGNLIINDIFEIDPIENSFEIKNLINLKIKNINNSIKFLINSSYQSNYSITNMICCPKINNIIDENNLIVKDLEKQTIFQWDNSIDIKSLDFVIIPLNKIQFEIFNFLRSKNLNVTEILNINDGSFFKHYSISKNDFINEINDSLIIKYHGPFYLFNNESYEEIAWPRDFELIDNIKYKKYFSLSNKDFLDFTKLVNPIYYPSASNQSLNLLDGDLVGYKFIENNEFKYKNINEDLAESYIINIKNISIINVEKIEEKYRIYLEITSNIPGNYISNISTEFLSTNFQLISKNLKSLNDIEYVNFILRYEYDGIFTNQEINKNNIIEDKILADLNFKLNI